MTYILERVVGPIAIGMMSAVLADQPDSLVMAVCGTVLWVVLLNAIRSREVTQ